MYSRPVSGGDPHGQGTIAIDVTIVESHRHVLSPPLRLEGVNFSSAFEYLPKTRIVALLL